MFLTRRTEPLGPSLAPSALRRAYLFGAKLATNLRSCQEKIKT